MSTETSTIEITNNERAVLKIISEDEFNDGDPSKAVWSYGLRVPEGMNRKSMGGVFASLQKKGLIATGDKGRDAWVQLLPPALELLKRG